MTRNQISFYATRADLELLLTKLEAARLLQFVTAGMFDSPNIAPIHSLLGAPGLGHLDVGDANQSTIYLVADREILLGARAVPQRGGKMKFAVDQADNPKTIAFRPGGAYGDMCLIAGQVGTASDDVRSVELFEFFSKELRRQFKRIRSFYVGREAREFLGRGWRLTASAASSRLYDLTTG